MAIGTLAQALAGLIRTNPELALATIENLNGGMGNTHLVGGDMDDLEMAPGDPYEGMDAASPGEIDIRTPMPQSTRDVQTLPSPPLMGHNGGPPMTPPMTPPMALPPPPPIDRDAMLRNAQSYSPKAGGVQKGDQWDWDVDDPRATAYPPQYHVNVPRGVDPEVDALLEKQVAEMSRLWARAR